MAKDKKAAKELTIEERLAQALVPVEEQPYKIPENWCWTTVGNIAKIIMGQSPESSSTTEDSSFMPLVGGAADMGKMFPKVTRYTKKPAKICNKGDLILCIRATLGRPIFADKEYCIGRGVAGIRIIGGNNEFFRYFFLNFEDYLYEKATGSTFAQVNSVILQNMPVPLPPLKEQRRIIDRIESIFTKLDEAKEKAQAVVDGFELRKSAILHKAFTGELTKQWRKDKGIDLSSWNIVKFEDLGKLERGRSKYRPRNDPKLFNGDYPFIQTGDVAKAGMYIIEHTQTLSDFGMEQSRIFPKGTLCITIAANIGDVSILTYDCCFPDSVVGFTPNSKTTSEFIYYMMNIIQRELEANAPATAQKNINLKILNELELRIPSISEQSEILAVLNQIFEKEEKVMESARNVKNQIDTIKKAILARAFRGKLGTNDVMEGSAVEVLKMVL